ncbi:MAG: hypothetical protein V5A55_13230 [Halovenus sp.]
MLDVFADDARARGFEAEGRDTVEIAGEIYETVLYRQQSDA